MTITRKTISIILSVIFALGLLTGCNSPVNSNSETKTTAYSDYSFWEKENTLRITLPITMDSGENAEIINGIGTLELSSKYLKRVDKLKQSMISYFSENYNIDISQKLRNQKLKAFNANDVNGSMTMGYVDPNQPEYLNLNNMLFNEYKDYFDNTYVHESLHQIGFISEDSTMITEGIVDALTDLILTNANISSFPTENYSDVRTLGYQILAADKGIVEFYLETDNPSMVNRITEKLKDAKKLCEDVEPGIRLECLATGLTQGISATFDIWYVAFEVQEITRAYCQSFKPDKETIDYIRSYYLVEDYENVGIRTNDEAYEFYALNEE